MEELMEEQRQNVRQYVLVREISRMFCIDKATAIAASRRHGMTPVKVRVPGTGQEAWALEPDMARKLIAILREERSCEIIRPEDITP